MNAKRTVILQVRRTPPAPVVADDKPMTQAEAAVWLSLSRGELSRMTAAGDVPHARLGVSPRYLRSQLLTWLTEQAA